MRSSRSRRIFSLVDESLERGVESEQLVQETLQQLVDAEEIFNYHVSFSHGELDRMGADFLVFPESYGWAILLQVKSSISGKRKHEINHPDIPCVVVNPEKMTKSDLARVILEELGLLTESLDEYTPPREDQS